MLDIVLGKSSGKNLTAVLVIIYQNEKAVSFYQFSNDILQLFILRTTAKGLQKMQEHVPEIF